MFIDTGITGENNVIDKETEMAVKYKDLTIEYGACGPRKTKVIPAIIGATGTISKSFRKHLSNTPGKHEIMELQKAAILGTAHILREVLLSKCKTFSM
jgi:hypothetical protein